MVSNGASQGLVLVEESLREYKRCDLAARWSHMPNNVVGNGNFASIPVNASL